MSVCFYVGVPVVRGGKVFCVWVCAFLWLCVFLSVSCLAKCSRRQSEVDPLGYIAPGDYYKTKGHARGRIEKNYNS